MGQDGQKFISSLTLFHEASIYLINTENPEDHDKFQSLAKRCERIFLRLKNDGFTPDQTTLSHIDRGDAVNEQSSSLDGSGDGEASELHESEAIVVSQYQSPKPVYQTEPHRKQPPQGSIAVFEWEQFTQLSDYSDSALMPVFQRISRDIIERPYHYGIYRVLDKEGVEIGVLDKDGRKILPPFEMADNSSPPRRIQDGLVYKQNHGTGHAMRQVIYTDNLLKVMRQKGTIKGKALAEKIRANPQMIALIKLSAFCKRIGRTLDNEYDEQSHSPTIYSKRSSDMFGKIATELGFEANLIHIVQDSMLEYLEPDRITFSNAYDDVDGTPGGDLKAFSKAIIMVSHMADLVRLFAVKQDFLTKELQGYIEPDKLSSVARDVTNLACKANAYTGNRVLAQEEGVSVEGATLSRHPKKAASVVLIFNKTFEALGDIADSSIMHKHGSDGALTASFRETVAGTRADKDDPLDTEQDASDSHNSPS
jgi:hypothetical protein